jgi:hypothetical protein
MKYSVPTLRVEMDKLHGYLSLPRSWEEEWAWWQANCPILFIMFKIRHCAENHRRKEDIFKDFTCDSNVQKFIGDVERVLE